MGANEIPKGVCSAGLLRDRILGGVGDVLTREWIVRVLEQHRPDDGLSSEEAVDSRERLDPKRVWTIDPLDSTREFASGCQGWAAHVTLVEDGQPTHVAVGLSDHGQVLHTGEAKAVQGLRAGKIVVSRTHPPAAVKYVADKLGMELVEMSSTGAKAMHVLLGDFDTYIHDGDQYEWDSATPVGVVKSAGPFASRLDGSASTYNNANTFLLDTLFCRLDLSEEILAAVKEFKDQEQKQVSQGGYDRLR